MEELLRAFWGDHVLRAFLPNLRQFPVPHKSFRSYSRFPLPILLLSYHNMASLLSAALWTGVVYFSVMSWAHFVDFKFPFLFVFYNVPSNLYQDKILGTCAFVYAILFYTAATVPRAIPSAIAALTYTVIGLSAVILSGDLDGVMLEGTTTTAYWGIISFIGVYAAVLFALYSNSLKTKSQ